MHILPEVRHRKISVGGVSIFYRESCPQQAAAGAPALLLLHGFPSSSFQFRRLIDALGNEFRIVAPDYPGFGHSDVPLAESQGGDFSYSFDRLADVMEQFVDAVGLKRFVMYIFDFGAPVGARLAQRRPDSVAGLIVQNGNLYEEGLSEDARRFVSMHLEDAGAHEAVENLLTLPATRFQYESGATEVELVAPDGWTVDQHFLDLPGRKAPQFDLAFDYKTNVARYTEWQNWLRKHQPPTLIVWGRNDPFFPEPGAHAYRRDLPEAEIHVFDTGHFALEEKLPEVAPLIHRFLRNIAANAILQSGQVPNHAASDRDCA